MKKIKKAVVPVAGLGTRFLPATKTIPKEMFPIVDKPSIQYIVEEAVQSGIEQIIFVNARGKEAIEDYFDTHIEVETILKDRIKEKLLERIHPDTQFSVSYFYCIPSTNSSAEVGEPHEIDNVEWVAANEVTSRFTTNVDPEIKKFLSSFSSPQ